MKNLGQTKPRIWSYDVLRLLSVLSIMMMHVTYQAIYMADIYSFDWFLAAAANSIFHYGVPVFVMISGALFLDPDREIKISRILTHNVLRMAIIYFVWCAAYGMYDYLQYKTTWRDSWKFYVWEIVNSRGHLWFLPMIIGIYLIIPLLSVWVKNASRQNIQYFLALFLVFAIGYNTIHALFTYEIIEFIGDLRYVELACGYVGYFVLGYYLKNVGIPRKAEKVLCVSLPVLFLLCAVCVIAICRHRGSVTTEAVDSFSALTLLISSGLFILLMRMQDKFMPSERIVRLLGNLGKDTLGAYVSHMFILEWFLDTSFCQSLGIIARIPVCLILCFTGGMLLAALLRRIPVIGKYIC